MGVSKKTSHEKEESGGGILIKGQCLGLGLGSICLNPGNIARVVPGRIMDLRFLPCSNVTIIVVGNNFGNVGFWDVDSEDYDRLYLYHPHAGTISGISMHQHYIQKIFTSCYLGFIQLMDVEKEIFDLVYSSEVPICSLSQRSDDVKCLYFSEGYGRLNIWDERVRKCSTQSKLHANRINSIDFNSQNYNIMATSSSNGTAAIWDLRRIKVDQPSLLEEVATIRLCSLATSHPLEAPL